MEMNNMSIGYKFKSEDDNNFKGFESHGHAIYSTTLTCRRQLPQYI